MSNASKNVRDKGVIGSGGGGLGHGLDNARALVEQLKHQILFGDSPPTNEDRSCGTTISTQQQHAHAHAPPSTAPYMQQQLYRQPPSDPQPSNLGKSSSFDDNAMATQLSRTQSESNTAESTFDNTSEEGYTT
eukprot:CAMPEP_0194385574 /NCGR_PEP_ID=MMETSP0174-20130528/81097_1 /TAXON_ID=216777 /ORGANISM="Proboscia alata, Strain PI-D3" /LENGTH=132 /DNA_ID=CAMNT_0039173843 /DNA_START=44 /DNA_END=438 /DNA_ORIENTATION=+